MGEEVGYSIRFEDVSSAKTRIKFMTDGMLLREALIDPLLSRYAVIMVDEAHERSLNSDVLLGLLKKIMKRRPELRIVVSSATIEANRFASFFQGGESSDKQCKIVSIEGRTYPVDVLYLEEPCVDYVEKAIETAFNIHTQEADGDVLVFLTGRDEIERAIQKLSDRATSLHPQGQVLQPLPLFAGLTLEEQMYVFEPAAENTRKVIFATNIAEASITVEGIVYVVDCGFVKLRAYNPSTNIETLTPVPISKASATQRAGRAGRTKAGKCFRLYTEQSYKALPETTIPEIQRSNLAGLVLQLKALGIDNVARFDFINAPPAELLIRALELLYALGAVDDAAKLTQPLGARMAELALDPMMSKVLLAAPRFGCVPEMLSIAAMTSTSLPGASIWFHHHDGERKAMDASRHKFAVDEGDHLTLLNVYKAFTSRGRKDPAAWCRDNHINHQVMQRAVSVRAQLKRYLERFGVVGDGGDDDDPGSRPPIAGGKEGERDRNMAVAIRQCLTAGYFAHAAKMQADGTFKSVSGSGVTLHAHPSSILFNRRADYVVFNDVLASGSGDKIFVRDISKIEKSWLLEYAPGYYQVK